MDHKPRQVLNILEINNSLSSRLHKYPNSKKQRLYLFECIVCKKNMEIRKAHISYATGKCKKHASMDKPFEAVYGAIRTSAKKRNLNFNLSYEEYLEFTQKPNCSYCGILIPWNPWNKHGQNHPGYFIDRKDSTQGYSKENCTQCCSICNMTKRTLTPEQFILLCKRVTDFQKGGSCGS